MALLRPVNIIGIIFDCEGVLRRAKEKNKDQTYHFTTRGESNLKIMAKNIYNTQHDRETAIYRNLKRIENLEI